MKTLLSVCLTATALAVPAVSQTDTPPGKSGENQLNSTRPDAGSNDARDKKSAPNAALPISEVEFVIAVAKSGMKDLQTARLAAGKASDVKVRELALALVNDHTTSDADLKTAADALKTDLPEGPEDKTKIPEDETPRAEDKARLDDKTPAEHKAEQKHEDLSNLTGKEFDRAFLEHLATGHEKAIAYYEAGRKIARTEEVITYIEKTLPLIRNQAEKIKQVQTQTGIPSTIASPASDDSNPPAPPAPPAPPTSPVPPKE